MSYIRTTTNEYPISEASIKGEFSDTSFSNPFVPPIVFAHVFPSPMPEFDSVLQTLQEGIPTLTTKGHYEQTWNIIPLYTKAADKTAAKERHLLEQKSLKKDLVNANRKDKELLGLVYAFPDSSGTIQTGDEDIRNVLAITTTGMILNSQGIDTKVISFRDKENVIHMLTPIEAITMGLAVQTFISDTYVDAWSKKTAIDGATTITELNEVLV